MGKADKNRINDKWDKIFEQMRKDEEIDCPYCGYIHEGEDTYDHITYHGEDPAKEMDCSNCDKPFWVQETVRRTYECTKEDPDNI